jgi:hypothetical protein
MSLFLVSSTIPALLLHAREKKKENNELLTIQDKVEGLLNSQKMIHILLLHNQNSHY